MRWSQIVITALFSVAVHDVLALSHQERSLDQWATLERRTPGKTNPIKKAALKATAFKSSNYRKTAMAKGGNYDPSKKKVASGGSTTAGAKNKDADHVFEAQSVATTLNKHGVTPTTSQHEEIKKTLNDPGNLVMVASKVNRAKGQLTRKLLKGKSASADQSTKEYMQATKNQALGTAGKLDNVMKQGSIFTNTQKDIHKQTGIQRRSVRLTY